MASPCLLTPDEIPFSSPQDLVAIALTDFSHVGVGDIFPSILLLCRVALSKVTKQDESRKLIPTPGPLSSPEACVEVYTWPQTDMKK
ncbi:hypothetical protein STEG23_026216 [Scotinomys teguina]